MKLLSLLRLLMVCWMLLAYGMAVAEQPPLRMGFTPATARGQYASLEEWRVYLQVKLDLPVEFVFRDSCRELTDLMKQKKLDFSWITAPAYLESRQYATLLASPLYQGRPLDRTYLIVPASDLGTTALPDLKNKIFAYADPASNTGFLEPRHQLRLARLDPDQFFKKTFFTGDHQKTIAAVAIGLADGGAVSGFAWESLALSRPDISSQTRVVSKSTEYGFPPLVARNTLDKKDYAQMQRTLLHMPDDTEGIRLLKRLNLDGFTLVNDRQYRNVGLIMPHAGLP